MPRTCHGELIHSGQMHWCHLWQVHWCHLWQVHWCHLLRRASVARPPWKLYPPWEQYPRPNLSRIHLGRLRTLRSVHGELARCRRMRRWSLLRHAFALPWKRCLGRRKGHRQGRRHVRRQGWRRRRRRGWGRGLTRTSHGAWAHSRQRRCRLLICASAALAPWSRARLRRRRSPRWRQQQSLMLRTFLAEPAHSQWTHGHLVRRGAWAFAWALVLAPSQPPPCGGRLQKRRPSPEPLPGWGCQPSLPPPPLQRPR